MKKEIILDAEQHEALCCEKELIVEGVKFEIMVDKYVDTRRHTEVHNIVFKLNDEFYSIQYENSVKDTMGWRECNWRKEFKATQVFPKVVETIIYE
jgi:hypothetical protein